MKIHSSLKNVQTFLLTLACCSALGFSAHAISDDGEQGGDIEGTESLETEIALTPTAAAPAGSKIEAALAAQDENGATTATLTLQTEGLAAGTYGVSVTLKSDGSTVVLGSFDVITVSVTPSTGDDSSDTEASTDTEIEGEVEFGTDTGILLPANFNPLDIATIFVTDANSVVLFTADLSAAASTNLNASVQATAGATAPSAAGNAVLIAHAKRGATKGMLMLNARGLPPSTLLTIAINGAAAGTVTSDARGQVRLRKSKSGGGNHKKGGSGAATLPSTVNLFSITSVSLNDAGGNVLWSVSF